MITQFLNNVVLQTELIEDNTSNFPSTTLCMTIRPRVDVSFCQKIELYCICSEDLTNLITELESLKLKLIQREAVINQIEEGHRQLRGN